jgi:hypothetical protein
MTSENSGIPENQTNEYYLSQLSTNGMHLENIPKENQTRELCDFAIKKNIWAFKFVNPLLQTEEMCMSAVTEKYLHPYVAEHMQTDRVVEKMLNVDRLSIQYIVNQTEERCLRVVKKDGDLLIYIKPKYQTEKIILQALEKIPSLFSWISKEKQTEQICINMVQYKSSNFHLVEKQTKAICLAAIKNNAELFKYVQLPYHYDEEVCLAAVKRYENLALIPHFAQTLVICTAAVNCTGAAIKYVAPHLKTAVILACMGKNITLFQNIDPNERTDEICLLAVQRSARALEYIAEPSYEMYYQAVKSFSDGIFYVGGAMDRVGRTDEDKEFFKLLEFEAVGFFGDALEHIGRHSEQLINRALKTTPTAVCRVKWETLDYSAPKVWSGQIGKYVPSVALEENKRDCQQLQKCLQRYVAEPITITGGRGNFASDSDKIVFVDKLWQIGTDVDKIYVVTNEEKGEENEYGVIRSICDVYKRITYEKGWILSDTVTVQSGITKLVSLGDCQLYY